MSHLLDTSVLVRLANTADAFHSLATLAVVELHRRGEILYITAQNLVEFRNAATRPKVVHGLGLTSAEAEAKAATFEATFPLLAEMRDIYQAWEQLVQALGVIGKRVHDARLVAVCHDHQVTHLLTFNVQHFAQLGQFGPGVVIVDPATV